MYIVKAEANHVEKIVDMSIRAFETDVNVGGAKGDCPPGFDSVEWHIGRIFIDSIYHRKGYGIRLMECIEKNFPCAAEFDLDTPSWNERTNAFYKRLGYRIIKIEDGFVFYRKKKRKSGLKS